MLVRGAYTCIAYNCTMLDIMLVRSLDEHVQNARESEWISFKSIMIWHRIEIAQKLHQSQLCACTRCGWLFRCMNNRKQLPSSWRRSQNETTTFALLRYVRKSTTYRNKIHRNKNFVGKEKKIKGKIVKNLQLPLRHIAKAERERERATSTTVKKHR